MSETPMYPCHVCANTYLPGVWYTSPREYDPTKPSCGKVVYNPTMAACAAGYDSTAQKIADCGMCKGTGWVANRRMARGPRRGIADRRAVQSEMAEKKLDKPALVGNTRFGVGVKERLVVERAQREYEYQVTPEKEAERVKRIGQFHAACSAVELCPKCGVNRFEAPCPNGHMAETMGQCPMVGLSDQVNAAHERALNKGTRNK